MNSRKKATVFLQVLAGAYAVLTGAVLPLYMKDGLVMIGDVKYYFYRGCAVLFLFLSAMGLVFFLAGKKQGEASERKPWSLVDCFVFMYGLTTTLSWLFSSFRDRALFGYMDWHMGLVTQLLLVWSYFFISRFFIREKIVWGLIWAASVLVSFVGVMNRYGYDVLGVYDNMEYWEWNRWNLLSSIGNINWYAGYLCLALPASVYLFYTGRGLKKAVGGICTFIGFVSMFTQGSMGGYAGLAGFLLVLLWFSLANLRSLLCFFEVLLLLSITPVLIMSTIPFLQRGLALLEFAVVDWEGWSIVFALLLAGYILLLWPERRKKLVFSEKCRRYFLYGVLGVLGAGLCFFVLYQCSEALRQFVGEVPGLLLTDEWGSGRGILWKAAARSFLDGDWKQRLFGAGPDCFAPHIYETYESMVEYSMQIGGIVFANAHNEWLNLLVNGGLLGVAAYGGILIGGGLRFGKRADRQPILLMGLMMLGGYCAYNLFSFQQIITTPIAFLILGMLESYCREDAGNEGMDKGKTKPHKGVF